MMGVMVISTVSFAGCDFNSEEKLKETVTSALEDKYGEEFVCFDVWGNGGYSYFGVCAPKKTIALGLRLYFLKEARFRMMGITQQM